MLRIMQSSWGHAGAPRDTDTSSSGVEVNSLTREGHSQDDGDSVGLLAQARHPTTIEGAVRCGGNVLGGALVGLAAGTLCGLGLPPLLSLFADRDLLPTIIHRVVVFLLCWVVGPLLGIIITIVTVQSHTHCARRRSCCTSCQRCSLLAYLVSVWLLLVSVVALSESARDRLSTVLSLLFPPRWPPPGYCEAAATASAARQNASGPWWHAWGSTPTDAASALVSAMSGAERASLLKGEGFGAFGQLDGAYVGGTAAIPRLGLPSVKMQDAGQGFRTSRGVQVGQVTSWPCLLALAATWDAPLARKYAEALGTEFRQKGANVLLGPSVNVHRVARNGRNAEYLSGEEPTLGAVLTREYVAGLQSKRVAAVVKHFVLNSQESDRFYTSAAASDRTLFEVYYPPFEAAIEAGVAAVMCSYNRINGSYGCGNERTLEEHLRGTLGFRGWVMSDWWALHSTQASLHGVDQDMPGTDGYYDAPKLTAALPTGRLERMAARYLRGLLASGALDEDTCTAGCDCAPLMYGEVATRASHVQLARHVAASSAVLLKNAGGLLPLRSTHVVALVGSACDAPHAIDTEAAGWERGDYYVVGGSGRVVSDRAASIRVALERRGVPIRLSRSDDLDAARAAAAGADVVVACGGGRAQEASDRSTLKLDQHDLLVALAQVSDLPPLVVAVMAPGAVAVSPWAEGARAIVAMFLAGQETGSAWADVLLGDVSPSGKLPVTFPHADGDMIAPCVADGSDCVYSEGLHVGWRGLIGKPVPFPFGYGLSYTTFAYEWSTRPTRRPDGGAWLEITLTNSGARDGAEVPQCYVRFPPSADTPPLVLRAFQKTRVLAPAEGQTLRFELSVRDLSTWREAGAGRGQRSGEIGGGAAGFVNAAGWRPAEGALGFVVGSHSRDARLEAVL